MLKKLEYKDLKEQKDRNPDRIEGTCDWFVTHPLFRDWRDSPSSKLLWLSANPGCGKSVLAKYLVDAVLPTTEGRTTCYFFKDSPDQKSATIALCAILHQLFQQNLSLLSNTILDQCENDDRFTSSFIDLWDVFTGAAETATGEIICILDAIDECEAKGWTRLARSLCNFYGSVKAGSRLKLIITSRPYVRIRQDFQPLEIPDLPTIYLEGEGDAAIKMNSHETNIFIIARTKEL